MRTPQLVIFLVCLNASALVVSAAIPLDVTAQAGGSVEILSAGEQVSQVDPSQNGAVGVLVGGFNAAMNVIESVRTIVFYGPEMLMNLGAPGALIVPFEIVFTFVVSFDIIQAFTGRKLS
jgi:hypothetical protein